MTKHILVPTDGSKLSLKAAKEAAGLARALKAKVTAIYVSEPYMPPILMDGQGMSVSLAVQQEKYAAASKRVADAALGKAQAILAAGRVKSDAVTASASEPWQGIVQVARQRKCDLIVMASHGRGVVAGVLLGSVTQKVLSNSKTPVLVCR